MSNYENDLRIFQEIRKHPWIPEHKDFIEAEIAKLLAIKDTKADGQRYRDLYDAKMAKYELENPVAVETVVEAPITETVVIDVPVEVTKAAPKKRGRSSSSPK